MTKTANLPENLGRFQINAKKKLKIFIQSYYFYEISTNVFDIHQSKILIQNIAKSRIAIISEYKIDDKNAFFILSFHNTIIVINQSLIHLLAPLFYCRSELKLYFIKNAKNIFNQGIANTNFNIKTQIECDDSINIEIENFNREIHQFKITGFKYHQMYQEIKSCIARYLIQDSYNKLNKEQIVDFTKDFVIKPKKNIEIDIKQWNSDDYIELKNLGNGTSSMVKLVYQIETQKLYAIKIQTGNSNERKDYYSREYKNYLQLNYPLLPKLYEIYKEKDKFFIKIQFINGQTLTKIKQNLTIENKIYVILQLMLIINHFHEKGFVYRDLKPENVIIDENKTVFVIDFDRMISEKVNDLNEQDYTKDFNHDFIAPEVNFGQITTKNDIYSLGKIIEFILENEALKYDFRRFFDENPNKRPSIFDVLYDFNSIFSKYLNNLSIKYIPEIQYLQDLINSKYNIKSTTHHSTLLANQNDQKIQFNLGYIYYEGKYITRDIKKSIYYFTLAANQNHSKAQLSIGFIYYEGKYITRNINKAIQYFTLASSQNDQNAQFILGIIYYKGECITRDVNKSIYYLTLAANQNHPKSQFYLGLINYEGKYIIQDINTSIYYLTLAANQNDPEAQYTIGIIYYEGKYIARDINKSIYYLTLAANQNDPEAQYNLGVIYYEGQYITRDINKSIYYLSLAANQNHSKAQFNLGVIYFEGKYITRDINKSIQYYALAANQNIPEAQFYLGLFYYEGQYITQNINKSIQYFTLAAIKNHPKAQYNLGVIYYEGQYVTRDINKSIYYLTLASNQKHSSAQFNLGIIYYTGQYITRDINKSIQYFTLAANQNHPRAQFNLGLIYYIGQYITRDINKSIHYFTLASNQNDPEAQFNLGLFYYEGKYIKRDINKSIYYFSLASNQNHSTAQFYLGLIYYDGHYITRDINKSIYYFTIAANHNYPEAQFNLGVIYYYGQYITRDINKSIQYFTLASNQNHHNAQYNLGIINLKEKNINRGLNLLDKSSSAGNVPANFAIGYLYHEGKYIDRNINKCIKYYKYASSFNNVYSKNNLGVIYKNGICDEIPKNIGYAIEYFEETVRRWEDKLSMYNLAHLYIYEIKTDIKINESIELLIKSSNQNFEYSKYLLCIVMINKHEFNLDEILKELKEKSTNLLTPIIKLILKQNLLEKSKFQQFEKYYEEIDFLYDICYRPVQAKHVLNQKNKRHNENLKSITQDFYNGFE